MIALLGTMGGGIYVASAGIIFNPEASFSVTCNPTFRDSPEGTVISGFGIAVIVIASSCSPVI
jgi:hypothetical protein